MNPALEGPTSFTVEPVPGQSPGSAEVRVLGVPLRLYVVADE
jgi:hypothetical protein